MNLTLRDALMSSVAAKNYGCMADHGAHLASKKSHKQYLRKNHLGKFAEGKR